MKVLVTQSCWALCDPINCSPPGSSVHGDILGKNTGVGCHAILQGIFLTRNLTHVSHASCIGKWVFTTRGTWEAPTKTCAAKKLKEKKKRNNSSHIIPYLKISGASSVFKNQSLNSILFTLSPEPVFLNVPYAPLQLKCLLCLINIP